ncbi:MAG TPA: putative Ig domain-containing protein, partial [Moraxellaceae bacterium]
MTSRFLAGVIMTAGMVLGAPAAQAIVTYSGTEGVGANVFNNCSACHNTAGNSSGSARHFETYGNATAFLSGEYNDVRANVRIQAGEMPQGAPLSPDLKNLMASWAAQRSSGTPANTAVPNMTTGAASGISRYAATLNASAMENGTDVDFFFRYSTSSATVSSGGGAATTTTSPGGTGGGNNYYSISRSISGLNCGTTYYYRVTASTGTPGTVNNFTTSACPAITGISTGLSSLTRDEDQNFTVGFNTNGGITSYQIVAGPFVGHNASINGSNQFSWTAANTPDTSTTNQPYAFTIRVGDGTSTTDYVLNLTVTPVNDAPVITSTTAGHTTASEGVPYTFDVNATDTESNGLLWDLVASPGAIPSGMSIDSSTGVISWNPIQATGNYSHSFTIRVTDNGTPAQVDTLPITINVTADNDTPSFTSDASAHTTATEGVGYTYDVDATDPEGVALAYSLLVKPANMNIDSGTGVITWSPPQAAASYTADVTVRVSDTVNTPTQSFTINVSADDDAPSFTSSDITTAAEQVTYTYDVNATDPENQTLTYSLDTKPADMTIDADTGVINWLPPQAGSTYTANVTVRVDDGLHQVTRSFVITVTSSNDAPGFTSTAVTAATEGVDYLYDVNATDPEGGTLTYSLLVAPADMDIDLTTGVISWRPPQATASYTANVTVRVTDGANPVPQSFVINVAADNDAPSFSSSPVTTLTEDTPYTYDVNATDPESETLVYGLSTRPANMTIDASTGVISWTPPLNSNTAVNVVATIR